ncbi:MAG: hypothetical protein MMC33_009805 [Icmadophila ericetorum]|nr:hypothetical protein [Icmadophila ericetorum]
MRLLNCETFKLENFPGTEKPPYAILSHTWGKDEDEVTLQGVQGLEAVEVTNRPGFAKITNFCREAIVQDLRYVWVDTCCIDKTSSSELSEAINSMFRWYQEAEVCYVYLADVPSDEDPHFEDSAFRRSRWFTRGWTLQELLAPSSVIFYSKDWIEIGTVPTLQELLTQITGIERQNLLDEDAAGSLPEMPCVAQIMSWASKRWSTRLEDVAYSLMGLFGVHMPIIYGEGNNAFRRLQLAIMEDSNDQTIFMWKASGLLDPDREWASTVSGLLASSPSQFKDSAHFRIRRTHKFTPKPFACTNMGLQVTLPLAYVSKNPENETMLAQEFSKFTASEHLVIAFFDCATSRNQDTPAILLQQGSEGQYSRVCSHKILQVKGDAKLRLATEMKTIYIEDLDFVRRSGIKKKNRFICLPLIIFKNVFTEMYRIRLKSGSPLGQFSEWIRAADVGGESLMLQPKDWQLRDTGGVLSYEYLEHSRFAVAVGYHNCRIWCDIVVEKSLSEDEMAEMYKPGGAREHVKKLYLDRTSTLVSGTLSVSVTVKRGSFAGYTGNVVDIRFMFKSRI